MLPTKFRFIQPSGFRGEDFSNQPIRNNNCLWQPCLLMDRDKMSDLYRGPSIDTQCQVSVHLAMQFQKRRLFRNQPIRNKNCLSRPCLLMDREKISNLYRRPSIDASYQVSVHLAKRFQRRRFFKSANQKRQQPVVAMFVNGSGQNEQSLQRTFHRCFLVPTKFRFIWPSGFRGEDFFKSANQRQELPVAAMFGNGS